MDEAAHVVTDPLDWYLQRIGQVPLLSREEERGLLAHVADGRQAEGVLAELAAVGAPPHPEFVARAIEGRAAAEHLVAANLRLVVSVAKRHAGPSKLDLLDLIQEGNLGLLRALESFDVRRAVRFATYATWWIRQGVLRAVANKGRTVRLPVHVQRQAHEVERVRLQVTQERGGVAPSVHELASRLQLRPERVEELLSVAASQPLSLDQTVGSDGGNPLGDLVGERDAVSPEDTVLDAHLGRAAVDALGALPPRQRRVLSLRFGLEGGNPRTLGEIGSMLSLSGERIRQLESSGLEQLRVRLNGRTPEAPMDGRGAVSGLHRRRGVVDRAHVVTPTPSLSVDGAGGALVAGPPTGTLAARQGEHCGARSGASASRHVSGPAGTI